MKNFEQIRAKNALNVARAVVAEIERSDSKEKKREEEEKSFSSACKKVPTMVLDNGILAAAAFALEKNGKYADVFAAVVAHLADPEIALLDEPRPQGDGDKVNLADPEIALLDEQRKQLKLENFIDHLAGVSSDELRRITAEAMAYLNYLRRFA